MQAGLQQREALPPTMEQPLADWITFLQIIEAAVQQEMAGDALTDEEMARLYPIADSLRYFGGHSPTGTAFVTTIMPAQQSTHTLQAGLGGVRPLYAIVPIAGKPTVAVGGTFTLYHFITVAPHTNETWADPTQRPPPFILELP